MKRVGVPRTSAEASPLSTSRRIRRLTSGPTRSSSKRATSRPSCSAYCRRSTSSGSSGSKSRASSGLQIDERRDANQDEYEWNEPAGDQRDLDERRGSVLAVCGDLFQVCSLRARMRDEASDLILDDLAGLELV